MINKNIKQNNNNIRIIHKKNTQNLQKITFYLIYAFIISWILFNGPSLPYWKPVWTTNTIIYMVAVSILVNIDLQYSKNITKNMENTEEQKKHDYNRFTWILIVFLATFISTLLLFWMLHDLGLYFNNITPLDGKYYTSYLPYHFFVVVCSETILFQGIAYRYIEYFTQSTTTAILGSAILFSIFHTLAYSGNISAFIIAFLLGCIFAYGVSRWNLGFPLGMHLTWNGMILGFLVYNPIT